MALTLPSAARTDGGRRPVTPVVRGMSCASGAQLTSRQAGPIERHHEATVPRQAVASFARDDFASTLKPLRVLEGAVDDPQLANPLARLHRLGTGWFGVILEFEGVLFDAFHDEHKRAWMEICKREGRSVPPRWMLDRAEGMKNEQVVSEVLCLARNPEAVRRLSKEKEQFFRTLIKDRNVVPMPGIAQLLDMLRKHDIPVAIASTAPEERVYAALRSSGLDATFDVVVTGDDVSRGRPDPEPLLCAAAAIGRPPLRCVLIGSANTSVEAAHEVGMQCVALASRHAAYELTAADLVVRGLGELSILNLKQLFRMEEGVQPLKELQPEVEGPDVYTLVADDPFPGRDLN